VIVKYDTLLTSFGLSKYIYMYKGCSGSSENYAGN